MGMPVRMNQDCFSKMTEGPRMPPTDRRKRRCRLWSQAVLMLVAGIGAPLAAAPVEVNTEPLALHSEDASINKVDSLEYRGGLVLSAQGRRFGGFSALSLSHGGRRLTALSDAGFKLTAALTYDRKGWLSGLKNADLSRLTAVDGQPLSGKRNSDIEAMAPAPGGGTVVSFERRHRLLLYPDLDAVPVIVPPPPQLYLAPKNDGIEALAALPDGRLLALTEAFNAAVGRKAGVVGWIGRLGGANNTDASWQMLTYITNGRYKPTAAAALPNGDVLVSERNFSLGTGATARIMHVPLTDLRPGAQVSARPIATLIPPFNIDNVEGIAVHRDAQGQTRLTLITDDNFSALQRTLLMSFVVKGY